MASITEPQTDTNPPPDERTAATLVRRSLLVASVGWVVVTAGAVGAVLSPDYRELFGCAALLAALVGYGFSTRAIFFAARSPTASKPVLFLEGLRRRVTDEPRIEASRRTA